MEGGSCVSPSANTKGKRGRAPDTLAADRHSFLLPLPTTQLLLSKQLYDLLVPPLLQSRSNEGIIFEGRPSHVVDLVPRPPAVQLCPGTPSPWTVRRPNGLLFLIDGLPRFACHVVLCCFLGRRKRVRRRRRRRRVDG